MGEINIKYDLLEKNDKALDEAIDTLSAYNSSCLTQIADDISSNNSNFTKAMKKTLGNLEDTKSKEVKNSLQAYKFALRLTKTNMQLLEGDITRLMKSSK